MTSTLPDGPICPQCGNLGEHACPPGTVRSGYVVGGVHDTRVGTIRQWAVRLDCRDCNPSHADRDQLRPLFRDDADLEATNPSINGHPATLLTRAVVLPPWREHGTPEPPPPDTTTIVWTNDEHVEILVNGRLVASANDRDHGHAGMWAAIDAATAIAEAVGLRVETVGVPNL